MDRTELRKTRKQRLYVVDGNGYVYRAFFALPKMSNSKGFPTNAIYGFTNMMRKLMQEEKPDYIAVAFDAREKTFRHESYKEYKIDRPQMADDLQQQIPYIRRICEVMGFPVLEKPGYEADDVIATLMEECKKQKVMGVMVTSDKDLLQLIEEDVYALDPMKDYFVYDRDAVVEKWGVPPEKIVELMSIMGDSIDNVPGVKGIGPKGALELITKFGSVERMLREIDKIEKKSHRQKIEEFREDLLLSRKLVELRRDVPIEMRIQELKVRKPDPAAARDLFLDLEFYSVVNEYLSTGADRAASYDIIRTMKELDAVVQKLETAGTISLCFQTEDRFRGPLIGVSLAAESKRGWYVPVGHQGLQEAQIDETQLLTKLKPVLESGSIRKAGYNIKQQILILRSRGIELAGPLLDPMVMSYVLNPARHGHRLEDLAKEYLQYQTHSRKDLVGSGQKQLALAEVDVQSLCDFSCENVDLVLEFTRSIGADLEKEKLNEFYWTMEEPLIGVLAKIEWNGVKIDTAVLERLSKEMGKNVDRLVSEIYEAAGGEFNINSPRQIGEVLFNKLKLPMVKKTRKTKDFSTSQEVLEELAVEYELPQKILEYRQFTKLKSTYVDALPLMIDRKTGRVHTDYQQTVAATGRLSSTDPNLQNIPIRTEWGRLIRNAFVAEPGNCLISADYSQIELRVMAHLSGDQTLIDSFLKNEDIHARTASEVFGVPMEKMTKDIRNRAKAINFGINYGQSPFGLSQLLGIEQKEAKDFIDRYFQKYPGVRAYIEKSLQSAQEKGYVTTMFGRRRYIPEIHSRDRNVQTAAQRAAINTPLQGTAADIIKLAMIEVQKEIEQRKLAARMIMQVHDELVFEVPENEVEAVSKLVRDRMENVCSLAVPLTIDLSVGKNWREAK